MKVVKLLSFALACAIPVAADVASPEAIDEAVRSTHVFATVFHDGVQVKSNNGVVILSGTVLDEAHRMLAENTASAVPGVSRVDNQLKVAEPAEKSDASIRLQLTNRLLMARALGNSAVRVGVQNGIVTLGGEASNLVEKNLAEIYAKEIAGVREVRNQIEVRPADAKYEIDDPSLEGMVAFVYDTHNSTRDLNLEVAVKDGHVTLTGEAPSPLHKNFITLLAETVRSVEKVTSNLATG